MNEVADEVKMLIEAIKQSSAYKEYDKQRKLLNEDAELKDKVDAYRMEIFQLQNSDAGNSEERMEEFSDRYADFVEIPLVGAFLDAEVNFCKMMQEATNVVLDNLDFE